MKRPMLAYLDALIAALAARDTAEIDRLLAHPLARILSPEALADATAERARRHRGAVRDAARGSSSSATSPPSSSAAARTTGPFRSPVPDGRTDQQPVVPPRRPIRTGGARRASRWSCRSQRSGGRTKETSGSRSRAARVILPCLADLRRAGDVAGEPPQFSAAQRHLTARRRRRVARILLDLARSRTGRTAAFRCGRWR